MAEQLTFDLTALPALGREDFFVSPANAATVATIEGWRDWPSRKLVLIGPHGAGKTHLAHVWAKQSGAVVLPARDLPTAEIDVLARGSVAVEDADAAMGDADAERALFHLHNLVLAEGHALLLTAGEPPARWGIALPDLASRMLATATAALDAPDDTLLAAVMIKQFADRQIDVDARVIAYLTRQMDRSFGFASRLVEALDRESLAQRRAITRQIAAQVLDNLRRAGR